MGVSVKPMFYRVQNELPIKSNIGLLQLGTYKESLQFTRMLTILVAFLFHRTDGIGLSAPQVGINVQLMVFNPVGERGEGEEIVLVNPRVSKYSKKLSLFNEGCLSFPGIYADVKVSNRNSFLLLHFFDFNFPFMLDFWALLSLKCFCRTCMQRLW